MHTARPSTSSRISLVPPRPGVRPGTARIVATFGLLIGSACQPAASRAEQGSSVEVGVASEAFDRYETERFLQLAYRYAPASPGAAGVDFSMSVWLPAYVIVVHDVDLSYAIPLGRNAFVAPRAGGTLFLAGSGSGSAALAGTNAGLALVILGERDSGMRFDVGVRRFATSRENHEHFWSASVGYLWR